MGKKGVEEMISEIEVFINNCKYQPLSQTKIVVYKEELEQMLNELKLKLPSEIERCKKIMKTKEHILSDARTRSDQIISESVNEANRLVDQHQITELANIRANEILEMAREQVREQLRQGLLEEQYIEIEVTAAPKGNQLDMSNEGMSIAIGNIFGDMMPEKTKKKNCKVKEARKILREQEAQKLLDMDQVSDEAIENAEQNGIIFIDEIDKIASGSRMTSGADVSREGVQRDILPIVEGSVINTKYGPVKTDHILFIGAGAFHTAKPTDLIPELQGRFPIRVTLDNLSKEDFVEILTKPENALLKQHKALLETEGIEVEFTEDAIDQIATMSFLMNEQTENIGARRLHTVLEKLLEDISFNIPEMEEEKVVIDEEYVKEKFQETVHAEDLDRYIL